jgi:hypothetical protein
MLFGAFLLCVLLVGFFAFNHIAGPAHASSNDYILGKHDGVLACYAQQHNQPAPPAEKNRGNDYNRGWWDGYHTRGC